MLARIVGVATGTVIWGTAAIVYGIAVVVTEFLSMGNQK